MKTQVAAIININEPKIQVVRQKTQFQKGGSDCGLFVIPYAVDLCQGIEPADVQYQQESMRSHLQQCLSNNCLTPLLSKKLKWGKPASDVIDVFCTCRMPELTEKMAQCDSCKEWFHKSCPKIPNIVFTDPNVEWKCCTVHVQVLANCIVQLTVLLMQ